MKKGYVITIKGNKFTREVLFLEEKPTSDELKGIIKEFGAVQAFVTEGESLVIDNDYIDPRGNLVEVNN